MTVTSHTRNKDALVHVYFRNDLRALIGAGALYRMNAIYSIPIYKK